MENTYKSAGVDVEEGQKAVRLMKEAVKETFNDQVLTGLGGFGGLFQPDLRGMKEPVLVSGTDGVGTKLKIAFMTDRHDTIGQDCVAMCVNDILCQGAKPLFFLDYLATGKLEAEKANTIVTGIAKACKESGAALIGGETAEMPGFYSEGEYDLAGFVVGIVDKEKIITGDKVKKGDLLLGLPSSGIHSNGFSLVRKVLLEDGKLDLNEYHEGLGGIAGEVLLTPTRLYGNAVTALLDQVEIHGISHITGGGFYENIPRMLPEDLGVELDREAIQVPRVFQVIQEMGRIDEKEMFSTFNMGVGMVIALDETEAEKALKLLPEMGEEAYVFGRVTEKRDAVIQWKE